MVNVIALFSFSAFSYSGVNLLCRRFFSLKKQLKNLLTTYILYSWYARCYFSTVYKYSYLPAVSAARLPSLLLMRLAGIEPTLRLRYLRYSTTKLKVLTGCLPPPLYFIIVIPIFFFLYPFFQYIQEVPSLLSL